LPSKKKKRALRKEKGATSQQSSKYWLVYHSIFQANNMVPRRQLSSEKLCNSLSTLITRTSDVALQEMHFVLLVPMKNVTYCIDCLRFMFIKNRGERWEKIQGHIVWCACIKTLRKFRNGTNPLMHPISKWINKFCSSDQDKRDFEFVSGYVPSTNYNKKEIWM
jgi:hypothetical protein